MSTFIMNKSDVHEILVQLYLRLNGYFTTGLIVHHPEHGRNRTEIDCLAVRHPHHCQPEREIETSPFLDVNEGETDLILCEVKSSPKSLCFNRSLTDNNEALLSALRLNIQVNAVWSPYQGSQTTMWQLERKSISSNKRGLKNEVFDYH